MGTTLSAIFGFSEPANAVRKPGQFIEHERFGLGEVIRVEGDGRQCQSYHSFQNAGDKQLLLRFADLK